MTAFAREPGFVEDIHLKLKGAREKLCACQSLLAERIDIDALSKAIDAIDYVGSQLPQWSKYDHPPVPESGER